MSNMQLPYQEFIFKQELAPYETGLLRKAVMKVTGKGNLLYHNHIKNGFRHAYPLIQYKSIMGKAAILYLGKAVNNINLLFGNIQNQQEVDGKIIRFEIEKIHARLYTLAINEHLRTYDVINWIPLQDENFKTFQQLNATDEQIEFLINLLTANILSFAKGVDWHIDEKILIENFKIYKQRWTSFKNNKFLSFNIRFSTNVFLPVHIGLGKGAAHNYGVVYPVKKSIENNKVEKNIIY